jgi:hypothetical protein
MDSKYHYPLLAPNHRDRKQRDRGRFILVAAAHNPNHPEYPSAHGCVSSSVTEVLASVLETHTINVDVPGATGSGTTLTTSQHFNTTQDLLQNVANARVWAGLRYRFSTTAGVGLGKQVADCDLQHNFQPAGR